MALYREHADTLHVLMLVKALDFLPFGLTRLAQCDALWQAALLGFFPESILSVGPERMPMRKTIAPERFTDIQLYFLGHGRLLRSALVHTR
jgi:hypothetical protein